MSMHCLKYGIMRCKKVTEQLQRFVQELIDQLLLSHLHPTSAPRSGQGATNGSGVIAGEGGMGAQVQQFVRDQIA